MPPAPVGKEGGVHAPKPAGGAGPGRVNIPAEQVMAPVLRPCHLEIRGMWPESEPHMKPPPVAEADRIGASFAPDELGY